MAQPSVRIDERGEVVTITIRRSVGKATSPAGRVTLTNPTKEEIGAAVKELVISARQRFGTQGRLIDA